MDFILLFETWIVLAIILSIAELFIPGGILFNLGIASLIVALGVHQKFLDTWVITLTAWFICASVLLFVLYFITERFFNGVQTIDNVHEDLDIYGKDVIVTETIGPGIHAGRVEFQGTTWNALSDGTKLNTGSHASIVCKDNISLIVEPIKN